MYEKLQNEILRNICAIKWRVKSRFLQAPFNTHALEKCGPFETVATDAIRLPLQELVRCNDCCLDPFWGLPVKQHLASLATEDEKLRFFFHVVQEFWKGHRPASLKEEKKHSIQRPTGVGRAQNTKGQGPTSKAAGHTQNH